MMSKGNNLHVELKDLPPSPWLVLIPYSHLDILGMGGSLLKAANTHAVSAIVFMPLSVTNDHTDTHPTQHDTIRETLSRLGIAETQFWTLPDQTYSITAQHIERLNHAIQASGCLSLFFPALSEPCTHCAPLAYLAWEALRRGGFIATGISYESHTQGLVNCLIDITPTVQAKRQHLLACLFETIPAHTIERALAFNLSRAWHLPAAVTHAEGFFIWPHEDRPLLDLWAALTLPRLDALAEVSLCPLVSVIIRTRNRPDLLRNAVRSVANQIWTPIELLVVNDGGDDVYEIIAESATGAIQSVQYLPINPGQGRSSAANAGLDAAKGTWIMLLDDDDWILPEHIMHLAQALQQRPEYVAAYSDVSAVRWQAGEWIEDRCFQAEFDPIRLAYENYLPIHAVLFRQRLLQQGCRFNENLEAFEDWSFWIQVARHGTMLHVEQKTAYYRLHAAGGFGVDGQAEQVNRQLEPFLEWARQYWSNPQLSALVSRASGFTHTEQQLHELSQKQHELKHQLHQQLTELNGKITQLEAQKAEQAASLSDLSAKIQALHADLHYANSERERYKFNLAAVYASRSWRITAPIRVLSRLAQQSRGVARSLLNILRHLGWRGFLRRLWQILRYDGLAGFKLRLASYRAARQVAKTQDTLQTLSSPLPELYLAWEPPTQSYHLQAQGGTYTYILPRQPENFTIWLTQQKEPVHFSILVPVYNTPPELLQKAIDSVIKQWYPHWELILADDASTDAATRTQLENLHDARIKVIYLAGNQGISGATNAAAAIASGEYIVFLDHDDELTPDCLYELARCIEQKQPDFIYSDEDKLDPQGYFVQPHFKPEWSPETMMSIMYTCHVGCIRTQLLHTLGGLRSEYDGCQDWDLVLRLAEITPRIVHIPKVLYHWRIIPASTASNLAAKPYVLEVSQKLREDALARRNVHGVLEIIPEVPGYSRVRYHICNNPLVSIIIPTRDQYPILKRCLDSIFAKTKHVRYEIIIMDNGSQDQTTLQYLQDISTAKKAVKVVRDDTPFNFSRLNNLGVQASKGELLLFLNNDTEVLSDDWLQRMGGYAQLAHIAAVGAKLLYPGGKKVQHAGLVNLEHGPGHAFLHQSDHLSGYFLRNIIEYNWLAVTGACLMITRDKFEALGGFDEALAIAYNDVELCFRAHTAGFYHVVCPSVRLIHHESASRGLDHLDKQKQQRLQRDKRYLYSKHPRYFQYDPFFNPNFHPNSVNFEYPA